MNWWKAYDNKFKNKDDLEPIMNQLNYELNYEEKLQATNEIQKVLFDKEK